MDKCSFTNGSCQHTEEGGWACSLMFLCLCNAPQLTTTPTDLDFQATKATFEKGSRRSRPKLIHGTINVGTERKRGGNALCTHTSTLLYPQFTVFQSKFFSSKHLDSKNRGKKVEVMIKGCVCKHSRRSACFHRRLSWQGGGNCGEDQ